MKIDSKSKKINKAWLNTHVNDPYVRQAQKEGYRSRAAYKLKEIDETFRLIRGQAALLALGYPVLAGWSRKSSLGAVTGRDVDQRMVASVAAALAAVTCGARIVRVHDVAETADALKVWSAAGLPERSVADLRDD